ncbi:MAG: hypothetical protein RSA01_09370 [Clostridium sp.]|uniref:hypothetical protein n=1 Tax=Clostridium sp. TaxID=1506 RepID=UPI002FCC03EC
MKKLLIILDGLMEESFENSNLGEMILGEHSKDFKMEKVSYCTNGYDIDSLNCIMNMLGYSPEKFDLSDRAYYEGLSHGIVDYEYIMRCNVVRITGGVLEDFTGGGLPNNIGDIVNGFKISGGRAFSCQGYKNLIYFNKGFKLEGEGAYPPHFNQGKRVDEIMPESKVLREVVKKSIDYFNSLGHSGLALWPWGISTMPRFKGRELDTGIVSGIDLIHGIGLHLGMDSVKVLGGTGDINTNLSAKLIATLSSIEKNHRTILHINGFDEAAHRRDKNLKKSFINQVFEEILGPLIKESLSNNIDIYITSDHRTDSILGVHLSGWVPLFKKVKQ